MTSRAFWPRAASHALPAFACLCLCVFLTPLADAQNKKEKEPVRQVVRYVAHKEKVPYQGKLVMVLAVEPVGGGRQMELVVKNRDMNKKEYDPVLDTDNVNALQKGEAIKIGLDETRPRPMVDYLRKYDLKPGEENPRTYVFENYFDKGEGKNAYTAVVLSKFDEMTTVAVPQKKSKDGPAEPDAAIMGLVSELKTGEVVEAEVRGGGAVPVLVSLDRYTPPQTGKFLKLLQDEEVADGQKGAAVEIEQGDKTVKALVPGKLQGKKWVSDGKVLGAARKLKPDAEVVYRTRQDGEKVWLKEIEPAPKPQREKATASRDRERDRDRGRDRGGDRDAAREMDADKDMGKAGDADPADHRGGRPRAPGK